MKYAILECISILVLVNWNNSAYRNIVSVLVEAAIYRNAVALIVNTIQSSKWLRPRMSLDHWLWHSMAFVVWDMQQSSAIATAAHKH